MIVVIINERLVLCHDRCHVNSNITASDTEPSFLLCMCPCFYPIIRLFSFVTHRMAFKACVDPVCSEARVVSGRFSSGSLKWNEPYWRHSCIIQTGKDLCENVMFLCGWVDESHLAQFKAVNYEQLSLKECWWSHFNPAFFFTNWGTRFVTLTFFGELFL